MALAGQDWWAKDLKDDIEIQSRDAQAQLETYARHSQDITRLMTQVLHKAQPKP